MPKKALCTTHCAHKSHASPLREWSARAMPEALPSLHSSAHIGYLRSLLCAPLPASALPADAHRASVVYFAVAGLDLLGALPALPPACRAAAVHWLRGVALRSACPAMLFAGVATLAALAAAEAEAAAQALAQGGDGGEKEEWDLRAEAAAAHAALRAAQAADGGVPVHLINGATPNSLLIEVFTDAGVGTMVE
jgi:hypothetical protein